MKVYKLNINKTTSISADIFTSKKAAIQEMEKIINRANLSLNSNDENYLTPFDFTLDEFEDEDINKIITTFEEAREYLGNKPNIEYTIVKSTFSDNNLKFDDVANLVSEINPKHIKALIAYNRLCTIAQAWNKADRFEPDFSNERQYKYFPWFEYSKDSAGFVYAGTHLAATYTYANFGSRLCFKTRERAIQFGKQFVDLWNDILLCR